MAGTSRTQIPRVSSAMVEWMGVGRGCRSGVAKLCGGKGERRCKKQGEEAETSVFLPSLSFGVTCLLHSFMSSKLHLTTRDSPRYQLVTRIKKCHHATTTNQSSESVGQSARLLRDHLHHASPPSPARAATAGVVLPPMRGVCPALDPADALQRFAKYPAETNRRCTIESKTAPQHPPAHHARL